MNIPASLERLAESYRDQGFAITVYPKPADLPPFAQDFSVEIVGKRGRQGVLVSAKKNLDAIKTDTNLTRYAEVIEGQPGWRFDLAALEENSPSIREVNGAEDLSLEGIEKAFADSTKMIAEGFSHAGFLTSWAGFEAAMRQHLRVEGRTAGWGSSPRSLIGELYSNGAFDREEFDELHALFRVRNQIVHGYQPSLTSTRDAVSFLQEVGSRLIEATRAATPPSGSISPRMPSQSSDSNLPSNADQGSVVVRVGGFDPGFGPTGG